MIEKAQRPRTPIRFRPARLTARQRLHALLRQNTELTPAELAYQVGCTTNEARAWKTTFFAKRTSW